MHHLPLDTHAYTHTFKGHKCEKKKFPNFKSKYTFVVVVVKQILDNFIMFFLLSIFLDYNHHHHHCSWNDSIHYVRCIVNSNQQIYTKNVYVCVEWKIKWKKCKQLFTVWMMMMMIRLLTIWWPNIIIHDINEIVPYFNLITCDVWLRWWWSRYLDLVFLMICVNKMWKKGEII